MKNTSLTRIDRVHATTAAPFSFVFVKPAYDITALVLDSRQAWRDTPPHADRGEATMVAYQPRILAHTHTHTHIHHPSHHGTLRTHQARSHKHTQHKHNRRPWKTSIVRRPASCDERAKPGCRKARVRPSLHVVRGRPRPHSTRSTPARSNGTYSISPRPCCEHVLPTRYKTWCIKGSRARLLTSSCALISSSRCR